MSAFNSTPRASYSAIPPSIVARPLISKSFVQADAREDETRTSLPSIQAQKDASRAIRRALSAGTTFIETAFTAARAEKDAARQQLQANDEELDLIVEADNATVILDGVPAELAER